MVEIAHVQPTIDVFAAIEHAQGAGMHRIDELEITVAPGRFPDGGVVTPEQLQKLKDETANLKASTDKLASAEAIADQPKT